MHPGKRDLPQSRRDSEAGIWFAVCGWNWAEFNYCRSGGGFCVRAGPIVFPSFAIWVQSGHGGADGVVTIDALAPVPGRPIYFSWDDHADAQPGWDLEEGMRWRALYMDQALSALIDDVYTRGLDERILILALGEFGRTPRLTRNNGKLGRDHWPQAYTALVSGGGLRMAQVVGATNAQAEYPRERPLTPQDLLATVYSHLSVDPRHEFRDFSGRPIAILGTGAPIRELV